MQYLAKARRLTPCRSSISPMVGCVAFLGHLASSLSSRSRSARWRPRLAAAVRRGEARRALPEESPAPAAISMNAASTSPPRRGARSTTPLTRPFRESSTRRRHANVIATSPGPKASRNRRRSAALIGRLRKSMAPGSPPPARRSNRLAISIRIARTPPPMVPVDCRGLHAHDSNRDFARPRHDPPSAAGPVPAREQAA